MLKNWNQPDALLLLAIDIRRYTFVFKLYLKKNHRSGNSSDNIMILKKVGLYIKEALKGTLLSIYLSVEWGYCHQSGLVEIIKESFNIF